MPSKFALVDYFRSNSGLLDVYPFQKMPADVNAARYVRAPFIEDIDVSRMDSEDEAMTLSLRHALKKHPEWNSWANHIKYNYLMPYQDAIQFMRPPRSGKPYMLANADAKEVWPFLLDVHNLLVKRWRETGDAGLEDTIRQILSNRAKRCPHRPSFMTAKKWVSKRKPSEAITSAFRDSVWALLYDNYRRVEPAELPWTSPKITSMGPNKILVDGSPYKTSDLLYPKSNEGIFKALKRKDGSVVKGGYLNDRDHPRGVIQSTKYMLDHAGDNVTASNLESYLNDIHDPISKAGSGERSTSQDGYIQDIKVMSLSEIDHLSTKRRRCESLRLSDDQSKIDVTEGLGDNAAVNEDLVKHGFHGMCETDRRINAMEQPNQWGLNFMMHCCFHEMEKSASGFPSQEPKRMDRMRNFIRRYKSLGWKVFVITGDRSNAEKWITSNWEWVKMLYPPKIREIEDGIKKPIIIASNIGPICCNHVLSSGSHDTTPRNVLPGACTAENEYYTWTRDYGVEISEEEFVWKMNFHWLRATPDVVYGDRIAFCKDANTDDILDFCAIKPGLPDPKVSEGFLEDQRLEMNVGSEALSFGLITDINKEPYIWPNSSNQSKQGFRPEGWGFALKDYFGLYLRNKAAGTLDILDYAWRKHFGRGVDSIKDVIDLYPQTIKRWGGSLLEDVNLYSPSSRDMLLAMPDLSDEERMGVLTSVDPMNTGVQIDPEIKVELYSMLNEYLDSDLVYYRSLLTEKTQQFNLRSTL